MRPKVKICGITNIDDAISAIWAGADALGFVFYKKSPRHISPKKAKEIIDILPPWVFKIGLFVNEKGSHVESIAKYCDLDFIQLHGDENVSYLNKLRKLRLIKAIRIKDGFDLKNIENLPCEVVLLDSFSSKFGGTGKRFDWSLENQIKKIKKPYIVSGGLTSRNVKAAVKKFMPYAVDVSSGVESRPGKKSKQKLKEFVKNAKS